MEDLLVLLIAVPLFILINKNPMFGIYLFLVLHEFESYADFFAPLEVLVLFTSSINKYLIFILITIAIKKNSFSKIKIKSAQKLFYSLFIFFVWGLMSLFWTDYFPLAQDQLKRLITFFAMVVGFYFNVQNKIQLQGLIQFYFIILFSKSCLQVFVYFISGEILPYSTGWIIFPISFYYIINRSKLKNSNVKYYYILLFLITISTIINPMRRAFLSALIIISTTFFRLVKTLKMKIYYTIILIFFGFLTLSIYGNNEFFTKFAKLVNHLNHLIIVGQVELFYGQLLGRGLKKNHFLDMVMG